MLNNKEQICSACKLVFGTTEAGDAHRVGVVGVDRKCLNPAIAGLVEIENKFGSAIWVISDGN
jgi:hypothetical protein